MDGCVQGWQILLNMAFVIAPNTTISKMCETTRLLNKHYCIFLNFSVLLNMQSRNYQLIHVKERKKKQTSIQAMPLRLEVCAHAFLNSALDGC
jgi:hypothetical protein